jgi:hypothetical protein
MQSYQKAESEAARNSTNVTKIVATIDNEPTRKSIDTIKG